MQKFRESASLDPKLPDPYLGLTHTYVYGLADVDNAVDSLNNAEKRGYKLDRRERAQLGDAYRARGERVWRTARELEGDQKRDAFERAHKDFKRCVEYFAPIVEFANAAHQLEKCERASPNWTNRSRRGGRGCLTTTRKSRASNRRPARATRRVRTNRDEVDSAIAAVARGERRDAAPLDARRVHAAR